ncbi:MAG TPA: hypothetical protein VJT71_07620 [Pyrinomonadaceae bacterium]|nr:hypothetical protein [Pyrinomonadaceae bacterium]
MSTPESYQRFRETHSEVSRNFATQAEEEQFSFFNGLQELYAKAWNELRQAYENYLQELQAASAGDDSVQRAAFAYRQLRREYSRIQADYLKEFEGRQQRMFETMNSLSSTANAKVLDGWIQCLSDIRQNLVETQTPKPGEAKPSDPKQNEGKPGKKQPNLK